MGAPPNKMTSDSLSGHPNTLTMDHVRNRADNDQPNPEQDADPLDLIRCLISAVGAEIEALKREREADQVRSAWIRLGAAHAKARLEKRGHGR